MRSSLLKKYCLPIIAFACCATASFASDGQLRGSRVLVYTKNGKGYVHDNIASSVACIRTLAKQHGFTVDVADTSLVFTEANLKRYQLLVFASTNNEVFANDEQRVAFRRYMEAGGGFVGIHSVTGTERNWRWFKQMVGETFTWHPRLQRYTVRKIDASHPSMKDVPDAWIREDECYLGREIYPGIKVLMMHDITSLQIHDLKEDSLLQKHLGSYKDYFPAVWYHTFQGGHVWITTLGHAKESYSDPVFINHLLQGMQFIASQYKGLDDRNAKSMKRDDAIF